MQHGTCETCKAQLCILVRVAARRHVRMCPALLQMAARETGFGAVEAYMHQGKLLALDLVVRLLENPLQVGRKPPCRNETIDMQHHTSC